MKKLEVKVCACTQCIMNGAMDIVESIESLQKLKNQMRFNTSVKVIANECLCDKSAAEDQSIVVEINGERYEKATPEGIASKIISIIRQ